MPRVHTRYFSENPRSTICMFDEEPFAVVVEEKPGNENWLIWDPRQWDPGLREFEGKPALGTASSMELGVRIAYAHAA
jgi:hypothetical protein